MSYEEEIFHELFQIVRLCWELQHDDAIRVTANQKIMLCPQCLHNAHFSEASSIQFYTIISKNIWLWFNTSCNTNIFIETSLELDSAYHFITLTIYTTDINSYHRELVILKH